jgi:hypothetical protein
VFVALYWRTAYLGIAQIVLLPLIRSDGTTELNEESCMLESFTKNVVPDALVRPRNKSAWNSSIDRDPTLSMVLDLIDLGEASGGYGVNLD